MAYVGFIPCRAGSERVVGKNTRPFAGFPHGLLELKLQQMTGVSELDEIIISSNDPVVLEYAARFASRMDSRVMPIERPPELGTSATSMERFIADYIANLRDADTIVWTHVTHPFVSAPVYSRAIQAFEDECGRGADSLLSATRLQTFLWRNGKPFNYNNAVEKWPRSQDLEPVWEINHAIYILPFAVMRETGDRVGHTPYFFEMPAHDAMDIDWEDQFHLINDLFEIRRRRGDHLV